MTTPTTGYLVNITKGTDASYTDLSDIFKALPKAATILAQATGFKDSSGNDLNTIFAPFVLGLCSNSAPVTNMISRTGNDLNTVFAPIVCIAPIPPIPPTLEFTVKTDQAWTATQLVTATNYTAYILTTKYSYYVDSVASFSFNRDVTANIILVGGGSGGGTNTSATYGNGGGGGSCITATFNFTAGQLYPITAGVGGVGGEDNTSGGASTLTYITTSGTVVHSAAGGSTALSPDGLIVGNGGSASKPLTLPTNFASYGGGGGGAGGFPSSQTAEYPGGVGGFGSSDLNKGVDGSNNYYVYANNFYGGVGGRSGATSIPLPFISSSTTMYVGGGGCGGSIYYYTTGGDGRNNYYNGAAGLGAGGVNGATNTTICNANNNSHTTYTVTNKTGIAGGYGAGGGATQSGDQSSDPGDQGFGGNGCVIIWWDNTQFS